MTRDEGMAEAARLRKLATKIRSKIPQYEDHNPGLAMLARGHADEYERIAREIEDEFTEDSHA